MNIQKRILFYSQKLPKHVSLVAVSKTKPKDAILEAYDVGQRIFGENKVQEMLAKQEAIPKDIQWHMIGHLQRNKVKYIAHFVSLIHSVDSEKLLEEINKQAAKHQRIIHVLLQVYIASETTKFGFDANELNTLVTKEILNKYQNIKIVGLMGMASFTYNKTQIRDEFLYLKNLFDSLKAIKIKNFDLKILSMGMSGDYHIAIACGSNMVRIGSDIFGG